MRQNYNTSSPDATQAGLIGHLTVAPPVKGRTSTTVRMSDAKAWPIEQAGASATIAVSLKAVCPRVPSRKLRARASANRLVLKFRLDQYYTKPELAHQLYGVFHKHFDPRAFLMVEPSAGTGSFSLLLPPGSLAYDIMPKAPGIRKADFLKVKIEGDHPVAVIGNPPYGRNASLAVRFFNRAAGRANVIAMIFPKTFRKSSTVNRLDQSFHLLHEVDVPPGAFLFGSKTVTVPAVFQIWVRRPTPRCLRLVRTTHPDFEFTTAERAEFVIQRVGAQAGRLHHDFTVSKSSHYFIRGDVETVMAKLDFSTVARNTAGNPSLAKSEIIELYVAELRHRRSG